MRKISKVTACLDDNQARTQPFVLRCNTAGTAEIHACGEQSLYRLRVQRQVRSAKQEAPHFNEE